MGCNSSSKNVKTLDCSKGSLKEMENIRAPCVYNPGDLIYQDEIFARALHREMKDDKCEFCHKSSDNLITCNECSARAYVKYCGEECQRKDAEDHRMECGRLHKLSGDIHFSGIRTIIRLMARIIFKIKGKSWHEISRNILGNCVTFEDIDSHYEEMITNPRLIFLFHGLKKGLIDFIGEENLPEDSDLIKIFGKVKFSSLDLTVNVFSEFCFGIGKFQHECIPNSNIEICDNIVKVWAIKKIEKSEKITVSRMPVISSCLMRSILTEDNLPCCKCTECSLPYGESTLTKVINKEEAYDAIWISEKAITLTGAFDKLKEANNEKIKFLVDKALEKQVGVLGPTNALRLKLLAIKGMMLQSTAIPMHECLLELEKNMSMIFGENYLEMRRIYQALVYVNIALNNPLQAAIYMGKKENLKAKE